MTKIVDNRVSQQLNSSSEMSRLVLGHLPQTPNEFWNTAAPDITRILQQFYNSVPPRFSLIIGRAGAGCSTVGRYFGLWSSCERLGSNGHPCLICPSCRLVLTSSESWRGRFYEASLIKGCAVARFQEGVQRLGYSNARSAWDLRPDCDRPPTLVLDGIDRASEMEQYEIAGNMQRIGWLNVVMLAVRSRPVVRQLKSLCRGAVYRLQRPSLDTAICRIIETASAVGHEVSREVAEAIAIQAQCEPQVCVGLLREALLCGAGDPEAVIELFVSSQPRTR